MPAMGMLQRVAVVQTHMKEHLQWHELFPHWNLKVEIKHHKKLQCKILIEG